ncbi:MAG: isoprenylcysteine carboxylmethyltransferase family protein [Promethearchaeota archaeon]|nr:MAG: isoprenylcysteine carboxylmethyltransferase family protein [Candidatus Lokiarchaeota archaeon]
MVKTRQEKENINFKMLIPSIISWVFIISQVICTFILWDNYYGLDFLVYIGYTVWVLAAIFGIVPIFQFKSHGGVKEGESYMKTTKIVTSGLYAIVRHPQYLAGILISVALACMSQHWLVVVFIIPPIILTYFDAKREDRRLLEKFGEEYRLYSKRVPGLEPISGLICFIVRSTKKKI